MLSHFWFHWLAQKAVHNVLRQRSVEVFGDSNAILIKTERSRRDRDQARDRPPRLEITISSPAATRCKSFEKFFFAVSTLTEGMPTLLLLTVS
jgi:hypothetical protein